ncbi:MAG: L,D-transpeptidase [Verrucomicrobiota bacterium]
MNYFTHCKATPSVAAAWALLALMACGAFHAEASVSAPVSGMMDSRHEIIVSVKDQQLLLKTDGKPDTVYTVSTSKFGIGDRLGSYMTPLGKLFVKAKIGMGLPLGAVFHSRRPTGEVLKPNAPGRDPIVTRILWLEGTEPGNSHVYNRGIYIHGTPQERALGRPASFGCIRMRSKDVASLCDRIGTGATVEIITAHLPTHDSFFKSVLNANRLVAANTSMPETSGEQEAE